MKRDFNVTFRENASEIDVIANMAKAILSEKYKIHAEQSEAISSIGYITYKGVFRQLALEPSITINFFGLFEAGISYIDTEDAEKEGNRNPILKLTDKVMEHMLTKTKIVRDVVGNGDATVNIAPDMNLVEIEKVRSDVVSILRTRHIIDLTANPAVTTTVAVVNFECLINWLIDHHQPGNDLVIKYGHLFEIGYTYLDDVLTPYIIPGQDMRIQIKSDEDTEKE